jgi:DNA-binding NarL/FixJ family response regulator
MTHDLSASRGPAQPERNREQGTGERRYQRQPPAMTNPEPRQLFPGRHQTVDTRPPPGPTSRTSARGSTRSPSAKSERHHPGILAVAEWLRGRLEAAERVLSSPICQWRPISQPILTAARWTDERSLDADDEPGYPREPEYLVLARVLLAQDRPAEALALLQRLHAAAATQGRMGSVIELRALQALALAASGDAAAALDALAEALTLAAPEGYVRVFADEGAPMQALLGRLVAAQRTEHAAARAVRLDYLARLLHAFEEKPGEPGSGRGAAALPGVIESLTARELEVLALLAEGKANQSIAKELVVSLDTVKKHISHVLDKLGAANRTEAVARARQLGLIP